jgi:hypothetical protein
LLNSMENRNEIKMNVPDDFEAKEKTTKETI